MGNKNMGFKPDDREISDLERELKIKLVDRDAEPFSKNIGESIGIHVVGNS